MHGFLPLKKRLQQEGLIHQSIECVDGPRVKINGRWILSFVSTGYLGLNQNHELKKAVFHILKRWPISMGFSRSLGISKLTCWIEAEIAHLVGQKRAIIFPSTTHLALDALPLLTGSSGVLFVDERTYPTSLEGVYAAKRMGTKIFHFKHNDSKTLAQALKAHAMVHPKIIVCDGVYSSGGHKANLLEFYKLARQFNAVIYIDDTHGIGVLGNLPISKKTPYGEGGGGTPRYFKLSPSKRIIHAGTLSKAFGIPVAFVSGDKSYINRIKCYAKSYTHSSPPSGLNLAFTAASLRLNNLKGDELRNLLYKRVRQFRKGLARIGVKLISSNFFPIQTIYFSSNREAERFAKKIRRLGIWGFLQFEPPDNPRGGVVRFVITAVHKKEDIDEAIEIISHCRIS